MLTNQQEWLQLQQSYDQMEKHALWLRLLCLTLWLWLVQSESTVVLQAGLIGFCWLNEALWKAQQDRAGARLLALEAALREEQDIACQWQSCWLAQRPGIAGLIGDYVKAGLKPTVAVSYLILGGASLYRYLF
ncbi:MAG: hypothetical protein E6Q75_06755 [Rheinheimera sp.]|nr:MAG: hypothetical protein E6Q75_06755 [Rheinheimera sp.]